MRKEYTRPIPTKSPDVLVLGRFTSAPNDRVSTDPLVGLQGIDIQTGMTIWSAQP